MTTTTITGLVDADIIAYQAAAAVEQPFDWGNGLWTLHAFENEAIAHLENAITTIKEVTGVSNLLMALTSINNWRVDVLPTYKMNRKKTRKPILLPFLRQYLVDNYTTLAIPRLEGDDILGILSTTHAPALIISLDKDLKTVPGDHYHLTTRELSHVSEDEANYNHFFQTLTGDTTDGYTGCPGIGPVSAARLLEGLSYEDMWAVIVKAFAKAKLPESAAIQQARVARICRASDFNQITQEVILWNPPHIR
jgi:DNA polymerase I